MKIRKRKAAAAYNWKEAAEGGCGAAVCLTIRLTEISEVFRAVAAGQQASGKGGVAHPG